MITPTKNSVNLTTNNLYECVKSNEILFVFLAQMFSPEKMLRNLKLKLKISKIKFLYL